MADRVASDRVDELLAAAGERLALGAWDGARERYERALGLGETAEALEGLAVAAWWLDDVDGAISARERAYVLRREQGQTVEAARLAGFLAWDYGAMRGANAVANGWLQRARRLVAALPPSAEQAWLPLIEASFYLDTDASEVLRLSTEAVEHAHRHGALDIEMTGRTLQGLALVSLGRAAEGAPLLDEGTAAATAGELHDPLAIGSCCCNMIIACERSRDFDRAGQWCEQLNAFAERTGQRPLLALCRAHHGTVMAARGEWDEAAGDLAWAAGELARLRPPLAGFARARLAQLRHRQGRDQEARELLQQAADFVLVWLVRAEVALDAADFAAALGHAERYVRSLGRQRTIEAAAAYELLVRIEIGLGDLGRAREAHLALQEIATAVGNDSLQAAERRAAGEVAMAEGDAEQAARLFEDAVDLHRRGAAAFDLAQARLALARALGASDRSAAAVDEADKAMTAFEELGARRAARDAAGLLASLGGRVAANPWRLTGRELEVLRLVADGLSNAKVAERLVISEHTVHRHVANIFVKLAVSTRAAAVAAAAERELLA
jgi:LuxR family transcriptional regulator, maltose regulon positive regulatory protein